MYFTIFIFNYWFIFFLKTDRTVKWMFFVYKWIYGISFLKQIFLSYRSRVEMTITVIWTRSIFLNARPKATDFSAFHFAVLLPQKCIQCACTHFTPYRNQYLGNCNDCVIHKFLTWREREWWTFLKSVYYWKQEIIQLYRDFHCKWSVQH